MATSSLSVCRFFLPLRDPRRRHLRKHLLIDIVVITLCAVIAGANDWQQVVAFARARQEMSNVPDRILVAVFPKLTL